jgi:hypothetical protein
MLYHPTILSQMCWMMQRLVKHTTPEIHFEPSEGALPLQENKSAADAVRTLLQQLGCNIPQIFNEDDNGKRGFVF